MALAANTASVQNLDDNAVHVVAKFQFFQHTAAAGSHENSVLKINCDALVGRTETLTATTLVPFAVPGDELTVGGTVRGYIRTVNANVANVVLSSTTQFANNDVVTITRTANTFTVGAAGAVLNPSLLALRSASWAVSGNATTRVALEWVGSPNVEIIQMGQGQGYFGRNNLGTSLLNNATSPTGGVNVSTYATPALSGYTIIVEFSKEAGFGPRAVH